MVIYEGKLRITPGLLSMTAFPDNGVRIGSGTNVANETFMKSKSRGFTKNGFNNLHLESEWSISTESHFLLTAHDP